MPKAKESALKALQIDERLAEAYTTLAWINERYDWNISEVQNFSGNPKSEFLKDGGEEMIRPEL